MPCARSPLLVTGPMASGLKRLSLQMSLVKNPTGNPFELAADSIIRHAELFVAASSKCRPAKEAAKKHPKQASRARRFWSHSAARGHWSALPDFRSGRVRTRIPDRHDDFSDGPQCYAGKLQMRPGKGNTD